MQRVLVKIEGLRDPATAVEVARLGADAVGLVFAPSPRRVTPEQAREVVAALPPGVATVGVFVNAPADEINRVLDETGIQIVQLHGDEPPEIVAKIQALCIKAFRVKDERWADEARRWLAGLSPLSHAIFEVNERYHTEEETREVLSAALETQWKHPKATSSAMVLLDAYDPGVRGGSGRRFNWDLITREQVAGDLPNIGPVILAGGLDADCVADAIRKVRPWAVDVASGVESSPGAKDLEKVRAFIEAVHQASI